MPSAQRDSAVENSRVCPADGRMPASSPPSTAARDSTWAEWATKSLAGTGQRSTCRADSSASNSPSAAGSPETTVAAGPLTAATDSRPGQRASSSRTAASGITTDTIPPAPPSPDRARERTATTRAASASGRIPATVAAAISPCEWPTTASGPTPAACQTAASETITAHSAGWTTSAASSPGAPPAPASTSSRSQSTYGASAAPHSASRPANTGEDRASSAPIPAHWLPCPGNTNTTRPAPPAGTDPAVTPSPGSPAATAPSPASSPARPVPRTTARYSNTDRVAASDQPASAASSPGRAAAHAASRPACAARPPADRPDTTHGTTPPPTTGTTAATALPPARRRQHRRPHRHHR